MLDHLRLARSRISTTRQRFSFDMGPGLGEADPVADAQLVVLVVGVEALGALHRLGVAGVADPLDDADDRRLVHGVGDDQALADLAPVGRRASAAPGGRRRRRSACRWPARSRRPRRRPLSAAASPTRASVPPASRRSPRPSRPRPPRPPRFRRPSRRRSRERSRLPSSAPFWTWAASAASISRSRRMVSIRAISLLTWPSRVELSSWPVTSWKRRLNSSCLGLDQLVSSSSSSRSRSSLIFVMSDLAPPPAGPAPRTWP